MSVTRLLRVMQSVDGRDVDFTVAARLLWRAPLFHAKSSTALDNLVHLHLKFN